ncbi:MAG: OmpA family protein [Pseudomonas sp.]
MKAVYRRLLWCWAGLLAVLLVWCFLPMAGSRWWLTLAIISTVAVACWRLRRHRLHLATGLPPLPLPADVKGALILVCGDTTGLFADGDTWRKTREGCYVATPTPDSLMQTVQWIAATHPAWLPQVSVMLSVVPELHRDESTVRCDLHQWRCAIGQCRAWLKDEPTILLSGYFSAFTQASEDEAVWFVGTSGATEVSVWSDQHHGRPFADWAQAQTVRHATEGRFAQALCLETAARWLNEIVLDELHTRRTTLPALRISLLAVNFSGVAAVESNLWHRYVQRVTTLSSPTTLATLAPLPFPDLLLAQLRRRGGLTPAQYSLGWAGLWLLLFVASAQWASFFNNHRLVVGVGEDLAHYRQLSGTPAEPKIQAQQRLREIEQQLSSYQRQGVPFQLGLGLYQGGQLYPEVRNAASDWAPPNIVVVDAPTLVRLDSLSLFDIGQSQLKPDSTRVLVQALINIQAKPGWLILVSGHTDATGDVQANHELSLKRAAAVRDWMLQTSDVPATCFAVQGFGDTRPLASNDSVAGRAANRRVEISLVPQASACQASEAANLHRNR